MQWTLNSPSFHGKTELTPILSAPINHSILATRSECDIHKRKIATCNNKTRCLDAKTGKELKIMMKASCNMQPLFSKDSLTLHFSASFILLVLVMPRWMEGDSAYNSIIITCLYLKLTNRHCLYKLRSLGLLQKNSSL